MNNSNQCKRLVSRRTLGEENKHLWQKDGDMCSFCGRPIYINQFSKNERQREYEKTWCIHHECVDAMEDLCDRQSGMANFR